MHGKSNDCLSGEYYEVRHELFSRIYRKWIVYNAFKWDLEGKVQTQEKFNLIGTIWHCTKLETVYDKDNS